MEFFIDTGEINEIKEAATWGFIDGVTTNPSLVASQKDWVSATFTVNRETNEITVMAFWKEDESYLEFSSSADFQHTMAQFARHFVAAPEVTINQILVDMSHDDL